MQLFVERASAANPNFSLNESNASAIAQICRRLDGIPLALELAAARLTVFSAEQVAARLDDRFRLLTGGSRTALPRQQTLRALIDWSYDLLSEPERSLFRRFSVFAGGCTYEAIEKVCHQLDVLDLLSQLVNKSLVAVEDEGREPRYRLLETVRQYARDKLLEMGEAEQARDAHFDFFIRFVEMAGEKLGTAEALEWVRRLDAEHDNIRAAIEWGMENHLAATLQDRPRVGPLLGPARTRRRRPPDHRSPASNAPRKLPVPRGEAGAEWQALDRPRVEQRRHAGLQPGRQRPRHPPCPAGRRARQAAPEINACWPQALTFLGASTLFLGRFDEALPIVEQALEAARSERDQSSRRHADQHVGPDHGHEGAGLPEPPRP